MLQGQTLLFTLTQTCAQDSSPLPQSLQWARWLLNKGLPRDGFDVHQRAGRDWIEALDIAYTTSSIDGNCSYTLDYARIGVSVKTCWFNASRYLSRVSGSARAKFKGLG